jgi:hypothetical protein
MKNQYVGDINDYRKYDLLQMLSDELNEKILIIWMLTPNDRKNDGKRIKYLNNPKKWEKYNKTLFGELKNIVIKERNIENVQKLSYFNKSDKFEFHSDYLENDIIKRETYFKNAIEKANTAKIIFFDPDNGIAPHEKTKNSEKFLFWSEIMKFWGMGKNILVFQYFPWFCNREKYINDKIDDFIKKININKDNIMAFNAKNVVYLFLTHDINNKRNELNMKWSKWEK